MYGFPKVAVNTNWVISNNRKLFFTVRKTRSLLSRTQQGHVLSKGSGKDPVLPLPSVRWLWAILGVP